MLFLSPSRVWEFVLCTCPLKREVPLSYTVAVLTTLWPFVQTFTKQSTPEPDSRLRDFLSEVSSLAPSVSSNFSSVNTFRFLSGFLSNQRSCWFQLIDQVVCTLFTWNLFFHKLALKFSTTFQQTHRVALNTHAVA
jgi:hypothetical protein